MAEPLANQNPGETCCRTDIIQSESKDVPQQSCWPIGSALAGQLNNQRLEGPLAAEL